MIYSPEPWRWHDTKMFVLDANAKTVIDLMNPGIARADCERIVACVNFLAGLSTADLQALMADKTRWSDARSDISSALDAVKRSDVGGVSSEGN